MALSAVSAAVEARAKTWPRYPDECAIRGLNQQDGDTPADGRSPYLEIQYPVSSSAQISTGAPGANVYRDEGAIRFLLTVETGSGVTTALTWIDEIAALFRGKHFDGVRTFAPTQPVLDDRNDAGGWFTLSFSCLYEHDTLG